VGLSGLITPSLDEMVFVASEMERRGMKTPLLIGGATTSRTHTAVKIAPAYSGPVIYVLDASRAAPVVSRLLGAERDAFIAETRKDYDNAREAYLAGQDRRPRLPLDVARARAARLDFAAPKKPSFLGVRAFATYPLAELATYIDWTPFFASWELTGQYPAILEDDLVGEAARALFADAQAMLKKIVEENWVEARGVIGFWPANRDGDDIIVWTDETRKTEAARFFTLRQQMDKGEGRANFALADFVAPAGVADYVGGFAVTGGLNEEARVAAFKGANDDYSAILCQSLCDRLAEAFAERMHARVRREFWGYAPDEHLSINDIIAERYQGIRPAPGYPAQPDHTEKRTLFTLLDAPAHAGMTLTESLAMMPASSVSGLYFSHPASEYFGVGRIDRDQVEDYARRKGWGVSEAERWLAPILSYDPARGVGA
jgi:5-methyltetrahydrofolate--homocysteine methyltransferase